MVKGYVPICAAKQCYNSRTKFPNMEFFGFPSDSELCKKWLENCGRTDLDVALISKATGYYRLCADHFEPKWFTDSSKTVLKRTDHPIPTIFINNVKSLLPRKPESISMLDSTCRKLRKEDFKPQIISKALSNLNPDTELYQIEDLCRFCMNRASTNHIEMSSNSNEANEIMQICDVIMPNKIEICDSLPQKVCQQCISDLRTCHQLMEQFLIADRYLKAIAKYSMFVQNCDAENSKISEDVVKLIPKKSMVMPLDTFKATLEDSDCYLELSREKKTTTSKDRTSVKDKKLVPQLQVEETPGTTKKKKTSYSIRKSAIEVSNEGVKHVSEITTQNQVDISAEHPSQLQETSHIKLLWQDNLGLVCNNVIILPNENNILEPSLVYEQPTNKCIENNTHLTLLNVKGYNSTSTSLQELISQNLVAEDKEGNCRDGSNEELSDSVLQHDIEKDDDLMYLSSLNKCMKCSEVFSSYSSLEDHYISTHQNMCSSNDFTCKNCSKRFDSQSLLEEHHIFEHQATDVLCEKCGDYFNSISSIKKHIEAKHTFKCGSCDLIFSSQEILEQHVRREHDLRIQSNNSTLIQQLQLNRISQADKLDVKNIFKQTKLNDDQTYLGEIHKSQLIENPKLFVKSYVCQVCSKIFSKKQSLNKHLHAHLNEKSFICDICGKRFDLKEGLIDHNKECESLNIFSKRKRRKGLLKKNEVLNLECDICGRKFTKPASVARHRKYHFCRGDPKVVQKLLDEPEIHMCAVCGKRTFSRLALQSHSRIHTGTANPFKCEFCSKSFVSHQQITVHERTHIGKKLFMCKCCNKGFYDETSLHKHELRQTNIKSFICRICSKTFKTSKRLLLHTAVHKVDVNYSCPECKEVFFTEDSRQKHFNKLHQKQKDVEDIVEFLIEEPEIPIEYLSAMNGNDEHFNDIDLQQFTCVIPSSLHGV